MRAPRKAGANKLDNPTWIKPNQQSRTELRACLGNEPCEAEVKAVGQPQCESVKVLSPEIILIPTGPRFSFAGSQY